jgi:hypothetical protein
VVLLQETVQASRHLEGTTHTPGHHRQVIGGIPQEGRSPIHNAHGFVFQGEQEVLAEEIAVKEAGRLGGRQMLPHPSADRLPIGSGDPLQHSGEGQRVLTTGLVSGEGRPERFGVQIVHPGRDASNQFPGPTAGKAGSPQVCRYPGKPFLDHGEATLHRPDAQGPRQTKRSVHSLQIPKEVLFPASLQRLIALGPWARKANHQRALATIGQTAIRAVGHVRQTVSQIPHPPHLGLFAHLPDVSQGLPENLCGNDPPRARGSLPARPPKLRFGEAEGSAALGETHGPHPLSSPLEPVVAIALRLVQLVGLPVVSVQPPSNLP